MITGDVFTLPAPTPVLPPVTPEAVEASAGYGAVLPGDPDAPLAARFDALEAVLERTVVDLAAPAEADIAQEIDRRVTARLADFRGAETVPLARLRAEARQAIGHALTQQRAVRLGELRQQIADTLAADAAALEEAYTRRRAMSLPAEPDVPRQVLAALEVPDTTAPADLLRIMTTDANVYARHRAQRLLEAQRPRWEREANVAAARGDGPRATALRTLAADFDAAIEARVPPAVRRAEQAERDAWQAYVHQARAVLRQLGVVAQAGASPFVPVIPPSLADKVSAGLREARAALRQAWAPVHRDAQIARAARVTAAVRG